MTFLDPVLVLVFAFQTYIFWRCNVIARADESDELNRLWNTFKHDIQSRAKRGDGPDWVRYMDEADRVHERRVDGMRVWATAALVVGIGGTMGALAYRLWGLSDFELGVLAAFAPALLASLSGVANNLLITLWLFGISDRRFEQALNDFRQALRTCSDENAPEERFADAVRDQLGEAFRQAVRSFPDAFAQLDRSVQHMGEAAAVQSRSTLEAAAGLQRGVEGLTASAAQIAPAADLLNAATTDLRTMPGQLRRTLDEARETWAREMRGDQDAFIGTVRQVLDDQRAILGRTRQALQRWDRGRREAAEQQQAAWRESVDLVQNGAAEIAAIVEALPATFTREIEQIAGRLGREFSIGAQQHVADLTRAVREGNETLAERIETSMRDVRNQLLNDTSRVVGESAEEVHRRVGEPLLSMLQRVTRGIEEALSTLPENATTFAASLSTADEKLQQSIDRLKAAADHLERAVELNENLHASSLERFGTAPRTASGRCGRTCSTSRTSCGGRRSSRPARAEGSGAGSSTGCGGGSPVTEWPGANSSGARKGSTHETLAQRPDRVAGVRRPDDGAGRARPCNRGRRGQPRGARYSRSGILAGRTGEPARPTPGNARPTPGGEGTQRSPGGSTRGGAGTQPGA